MRAPDQDHVHESGDEHVGHIHEAMPHGGPHAVDRGGHDHPEHEHAGHDHAEHDQTGHEHGHDHEHADHSHGHDHAEHDHPGILGQIQSAIPFLHHHGEPRYDPTLESSDRGIWAVKVSLVGMALTALLQVAVYFASGSVGLLADTIHNGADALTALPLWLAFALGRRAANRRYTYGYGRAEDVAGVVIVGVILTSALIAAYESVRRLADPIPPSNLGWVAVAAVVGFVGNEAVAAFRTRVGREIGSAALIADGEHARVDGLTSLSVLLGALGVLAGFPLADPIVGLLITVAILFVVKDAALRMWERLMDAIDPSMVDGMEATARGVPGVDDVHDLRVRWLGHRLQADLHITADGDLPTRQTHLIAEEVRHALLHEQPQLAAISVHVDPREVGETSHHELTQHHLPRAVKGREDGRVDRG